MKQRIFNILSIVFLSSLAIHFGIRFYDAYKDSKEKKDETYISDKLKNTISKYTLNNPLSKIDDEYYFTGKTNNNYLKYQGYLWRIIKINNNDEIIAISEDTITYLPYNNVITWLNNNKIIKELDINYNLLTNTSLCIDTYTDIKKAECNNNNKDNIVGILNIKDYLKVGGDNSYINNGTNYWVSDKYDNDKSWFISKEGKISSADITNKYGVRPVITIKNKIKYIHGNGSIDNPYLIEKRTIKTLANTFQGEYISFNNEIWRIMYNKDNKVKIISTEYMKDSKGKNIKYNFDDKNNKINKNSKIINYINTIYLKELSKKYNKYLTNGVFYTGIYPKIKNNYAYSYNKQGNLYIGLPSINEPFIYDLDNILLMNASNVDDLTIYSIHNNTLYEDLVTSVRYIRPVVYIKDSVNIKSGKGSKTKPYILEV